MKDETISIKDAFTCKHLLPCGLCEKTDKLCTQQTPKRYVVAVKFKCKECGERYEVYFSPLQRRLDLLERTLSSRKCEKCGGQLEEIERYVDEKG